MKSDIQLQKDVAAELSWTPSVDSTQIGVEVKDGIVTLTGHVGTYAEKWEAEHAAQRVAGLLALTVEIEVRLPGPSKRTDVDIARSVENVMQWATDLPSDHVKVMVENSWITLTGEVDWDYQRQAAANAVRHLMGVRGVSCNIAIKPRVGSTAVKSDIEAALKRRATADAQNIDVEVHGTDVTLSGTASSWSERELAARSAYGTAGVRNVVNNIAVSLS